MSTRSNCDALLDQEGADLIARRYTPGNQPRMDSIQCLQVQLVLALLLYGSKVMSERSLGNRFIDEHNKEPKPLVWTADPSEIIAAVN